MESNIVDVIKTTATNMHDLMMQMAKYIKQLEEENAKFREEQLKNVK